MTVYFDTSSLLKLYVDEPGSAEAAQLLADATVAATSLLAYPEARAALARRRREHRMTRTQLKQARQQLHADWAAMLVLPLDADLMQRAGDLAESHALRGADAVHLSSFERLMSMAEDEDVRFVSADEQLNKAAKRLG